ncbi:MerR family transcriptional regulator [Haliea atlantica]
MRVNEFAGSIGVFAHTIRFCTRKGLLRPERCPTNGYREYRAMKRKPAAIHTGVKLLSFYLGEVAQIFEGPKRVKRNTPSVPSNDQIASG